jgi:hypothetical protein
MPTKKSIFDLAQHHFHPVPTTATPSTVTKKIDCDHIHVSGNIGVGVADPSSQLQLSTDAAKKLSTCTWQTACDERIKINISLTDLTVCYDILKSLPLKTYTYDPAYIPDIPTMMGWIAQDIQKVLPDCVSVGGGYGFTDFLSVDADQIFKVMYGAQQRTIQRLEAAEATIATLTAEAATNTDAIAALTAAVAALTPAP